ncbi:hypothetical protein UFOVP470_2 [uncultured Caudovirales phage]|uniref:Uncharacterized protein n=1 Tax=uncultured Caudovirales phage TaxID=2100421 RepID=A0A6J5MEZ3_9CAUD|nr:hypothetical protein UFOVP470_2 [uncultured Caudovirales phage]
MSSQRHKMEREISVGHYTPEGEVAPVNFGINLQPIVAEVPSEVPADEAVEAPVAEVPSE